ncbi:MAG: PilZ domain-containing protein [Polyangiaceae bacterium]
MQFASMQQRRAIRRAVEVPCTLFRARDFHVVGRRGLDLSTDGMLIGAFDDLYEGERVFVSFTLTQFSIPFRVEGQVARVIRGRREKDRMPAVGVSFENIDAVSRLILRGHLRRIPPVLPARARRIDYAATISRLLDEAA